MKSISLHRIIFERPQLEDLAQAYTVVDMHFHSELSDGHASIEDIARRALELGIGIAVTDHNAIHGAVEIDRFKNVFSIPGIELTSYEGTHLLVYFYDIKGLLRFYSRHVQPFIGAVSAAAAESSLRKQAGDTHRNREQREVRRDVAEGVGRLPFDHGSQR